MAHPRLYDDNDALLQPSADGTVRSPARVIHERPSTDFKFVTYTTPRQRVSPAVQRDLRRHVMRDHLRKRNTAPRPQQVRIPSITLLPD